MELQNTFYSQSHSLHSFLDLYLIAECDHPGLDRTNQSLLYSSDLNLNTTAPARVLALRFIWTANLAPHPSDKTHSVAQRVSGIPKLVHSSIAQARPSPLVPQRGSQGHHLPHCSRPLQARYLPSLLCPVSSHPAIPGQLTRVQVPIAYR